MPYDKIVYANCHKQFGFFHVTFMDTTDILCMCFCVYVCVWVVCVYTVVNIII